MIRECKQRVISLAVTAAYALLLPSIASGTPIMPVYGTAANLTGSRSEGAGIATHGAYVGSQGTIEWDIIPQAGGLYRYTYTFTKFNAVRGAGISHFTLDLTDDCVVPGDPGCVTGFTGGEVEFGTFGPHPSNPGFPAGASIIGVKFDVGLSIYSFTSNRAPVWGDFYIKGGDDHSAWNTGLINHLSDNVLDFIARPNGADEPAVPEPASFVLLGGGLTLVAVAKRRRLLK